MYYRGGTLRFGKLTMNDADLKIIDADPKNPFDFSLDHYNAQLVAGTSKNTPNFGLVVYMPDYYKVHSGAQSKVSLPSNNDVASAKQETNKPIKEFTFETKELFGEHEALKLSKEKALKDAGSFLKKNPDSIVVVKVQSGSERTKADNLKLSESRAMVVRQHLTKKFKLNETSFKIIAQATTPKDTKPESVTISVYSENRENRAITARNR
jgi:outer membrane protein OmpA-like peptidoglycan-associated protein